MSNLPHERLEALAEEVVFRHEFDDDSETMSLATARGEEVDEVGEFERVAVLATAAFAGAEEPPPMLAARLAAAGLEFCAHARRTSGATKSADPTSGSIDRGSIDNRALRGTSGPGHAGRASGFPTPQLRPASASVSFLLGAAAAALILWFGVFRSETTPIDELRRKVLATDETAVQMVWQPGPSELRGDVSGDVVWSQERQDGWLTFKGLPRLDEEHAYQLWIVDASRTDKEPVDGGVFQIADSGEEALIPIRAKLPIGKPAAFVITVEGKQGVVVSKQEHVVAIASL